jgi:AcrR family transcriptional regulator
MEPAPDQTSPPAGRPRDPRIDAAVLAATAELVLENGYPGVTVAAVAARAGTTPPAIYRRWRSLPHLVHEAAFPDGEAMALPRTGSLAGDVRAMVRGAADVFSAPVARAALPGLLAAIGADRDLHAALLARFQDGVWGAMQARLEQAIISGEARADVDPAALIETIGGATLLGLLIRSDEALDDAWVDRVATLVLKGVTP